MRVSHGCNREPASMQHHTRHRPLVTRLLRAATLLGLGSTCIGCSPFYVMRAAYEEGKILANRRSITTVLNAPDTSAEERSKLTLVLEAREFALGLGLTPGTSFTKYTRVNKDTLAWVVVGSKPDSFSLYTWWFPLVGRVPYKGFFDRGAADGAAARLERDGYESWVRGTEAISTLGWFNDPVLSTTLRHEPPRIVNTVIHETLHATVWLPNHVEFNESLANFVGTKGMAQFYRSKAQRCVDGCEAATNAAEAVCRTLQSDMQLAGGVEALHDELNTLYNGGASRAEKLRQRDAIFARHTAELRKLFPKMSALQKLNNAELIQLKLYMTKLLRFEALYRSSGRSWDVFLAAMRDIAAEVEDDSSADPFALMERRIAATSSQPLTPAVTTELCQ
ncbi:MAG: hypothetical protein EBZ48_10895 [Proteobacteria bacterium]|nr:hypothetical protein [Pseudomonadota bacterium]